MPYVVVHLQTEIHLLANYAYMHKSFHLYSFPPPLLQRNQLRATVTQVQSKQRLGAAAALQMLWHMCMLTHCPVRHQQPACQRLDAQAEVRDRLVAVAEIVMVPET